MDSFIETSENKLKRVSNFNLPSSGAFKCENEIILMKCKFSKLFYFFKKLQNDKINFIKKIMHGKVFFEKVHKVDEESSRSCTRLVPSHI